MQNTYILYHANCLDGCMSAAIAYNYFTQQSKSYAENENENEHEISFNHLEDIKRKIKKYDECIKKFMSYIHLIPVSYQEDPPELLPNSIVYIVDFSYPREIILKLQKKHQQVTILDHHKSAQEALLGIKGAFFDMKKSGAMLTWNYFILRAGFIPDKTPPLAVQLIQDRDLWLWELPDTKAFTEALYNLKGLDPKDWTSLLASEQEVHSLINQGEALVKASQKQVEKQLSLMYWSKLPQHDDLVPFINSPHLISETCQAMYQKYPDAPYVVMWYQHGETIKVSLRSSKDGADVSAVAKVYLGGGHQAASGFTISVNQWFN